MAAEVADSAHPFFTIGHSGSSVDEVADLLKDAGADMWWMSVRCSVRANPQFNIDELPTPWRTADRLSTHRRIGWVARTPGRHRDLAKHLLAERKLPELCRLRYDACLQGGARRTGRPRVRRTCAVMCAEVLWWRCHRRIIADYLLAEGATVFHILGPESVKSALPTPGIANVRDGLIYGIGARGIVTGRC